MSEKLSFREIRAADSQALQQLFPHWSRAKLESKLKKTLASREEKRFLALLQGTIVAHIKASFHNRPKQHIAELSSLIVLPQCRHHSIATALMKHALQKMPKKIELVLLQVASTNKSIRIYKKLAFKRYGQLKKAVKGKRSYKDNILMFKAI